MRKNRFPDNDTVIAAVAVFSNRAFFLFFLIDIIPLRVPSYKPCLMYFPQNLAEPLVGVLHNGMRTTIEQLEKYSTIKIIYDCKNITNHRYRCKRSD